MKKILTIVLAAMLCALLASCGEDGAPEGGAGETGSGGAPGGAAITAGADDPSGAAGKVTVEDNRVIYTTEDGLGNTSVTEYLYKDGALDEIVMTMHCADAAAAKALCESYASGELKDYAAELYSEIRQDGTQVRLTYRENYLTTFSSMTMEQLAALLETGEPSAAGGGANSGAGGGTTGAKADSGKTTVNTSWEELPLPEGFPKLAEGVTNYTKYDESNFSLDWDFLPESAAADMAAGLEEWCGAKAEVFADDAAGANWSISAEKYSVTLTYYKDTFGGTMPQAVLGVAIWQ